MTASSRTTLVIGGCVCTLIIMVALILRDGRSGAGEESLSDAQPVVRQMAGRGQIVEEEPATSSTPRPRTRSAAAGLKKAYKLGQVDDVWRWGRELGAFDPERALELLSTLNPDWREARTLSNLDNALFRSILGGWVSRDAAGASTWTLELPRNRRVGGITQLARDWCLIDRDSAVTWAESLPQDHERGGALLVIAAQVLQSDPTACYLVASRLPESRSRHNLMSAIAKSAIKDSDHIRAAMAAVSEFIDGNVKRQYTHQIAAEWGPRMPDQVAAWIEELELTVGRDVIVFSFAKGWASADFSAATTWARQLDSPQDAANALGGIAVSMAGEDLEAARGLAESIEESTGRASALREIARLWTVIEIESAARWLESLPEGQSRDHAIYAFVSAGYQADPGLALAWCQMIGNGGMYEQAALLAGREWLRVDPDTASAWITESRLAGSTKRQLLESF